MSGALTVFLPLDKILFMMFQVPFGFPCCFWNFDEKCWRIMACLIVLNLFLYLL